MRGAAAISARQSGELCGNLCFHTLGEQAQANKDLRRARYMRGNGLCFRMPAGGLDVLADLSQ